MTTAPAPCARTLIEAGDAAWNAARPDLAHDRYAEAEALARQSGDRAALARALTSRGLCLYERCREDDALALHEEALRLRPDDDPGFGYRVSRRIAACLMDLGRHAQADAALGPEPSDGASPEVILGWRHYRMQLAQRTGDLEAALCHAADIRDDWSVHGHLPEIRAMANAMIVAVTVRAVLGTDAERADLREELARFDQAGLSLNLRSNLAVLRAEMAFDAGDPDAALAILETATAAFVAEYGRLPSDLLVATIDILAAAGRAGTVFDWLDRLWQGGLTDGTAVLGDAPPDTADLVARLLDLPALADRTPAIWRDARRRALELSDDPGTPEDALWHLREVLSRRLDAAPSRLLLAKQACAVVARTQVPDLVFPGARRRHAEARMRPFRTALGLLYDMGRLAEARAVHDLAQDLRRDSGLPSRIALDPAGLLSPDERAVADRPMSPDKIDGLIDGTIWPARPSRPRAAHPERTDATILRFAQTERGWIVDASGPAGGRRHVVDAATGMLARGVHAILSAGEAGRHDPEAVRCLRKALIDPVEDLLGGDGAPILVSAGGCLSGLPFRCLKPDADWRYLRGRGAAPVAASRSWRKVAMLWDGQVDATHEVAVLDATFRLSRHATGHDGLAAALADGADVLHVAGHFEARGTDPMRSGLRGAGGAVLTVRAIEDALRQGPVPPLVCLSLCETAGTIPVADDEIDLPGLFLDAGSAAVIAAAWRIGDAEAARFACRFYPELARTGDPGGAFAACGADAAAFMLFVGGGAA